MSCLIITANLKKRGKLTERDLLPNQIFYQYKKFEKFSYGQLWSTAFQGFQEQKVPLLNAHSFANGPVCIQSHFQMVPFAFGPVYRCSRLQMVPINKQSHLQVVPFADGISLHHSILMFPLPSNGTLTLAKLQHTFFGGLVLTYTFQILIIIKLLSNNMINRNICMTLQGRSKIKSVSSQTFIQYFFMHYINILCVD